MIDLAQSLNDQLHNQRRETSHGPMCKTLPDLCRYKQAIRATRPTLLLETGTWTGASAHWFAHQMVMAQPGEPVAVLTIDIQNEIGYALEGQHRYMVARYRGDSANPEMVELLREILTDPDQRVMAVLDSDHSAAHVARELELWAPFVSAGCYLVVEDTLTRYMQNHAGYEGSPADALDEWGPEAHGFEVDLELEDMLPATQHPGGWLRRGK